MLPSHLYCLSIKVNALQQNLSSKKKQSNSMQTYIYPYSPQRKQPFRDDVMRKQQIKQKLDAYIQNDFTVLRKGKEIDSEGLMLKYQNPLVLQYVRSIYDEYHINDPLNGCTSFSRVTMTPSAKKTTKKQKMHLMSNQTVKYSSPAQLKGSNERDNTYDQFDLVEDESSLIRKQFQNNTTIRASMSYFDVGPDLKDRQSSIGDLRTKNNTLENQHDQSSKRFQHYTKKGLNMIVEDEVRPEFDEPLNSQRILPNIQLPQVGEEASREGRIYLTQIPTIQKSSAIRNGNDGYVDESFRYCVGCEQPLLHANIKHHQSACKEFQLVFEMPGEEIVKYLKRKINKFEESIAKASLQLLNGDANELQEYSQRMMKESRSISDKGVITRGFEKQYEKVINIGKRWCLMTEQINKVNWFLKIRQRIKQEFQL